MRALVLFAFAIQGTFGVYFFPTFYENIWEPKENFIQKVLLNLGNGALKVQKSKEIDLSAAAIKVNDSTNTTNLEVYLNCVQHITYDTCKSAPTKNGLACRWCSFDFPIVNNGTCIISYDKFAEDCNSVKKFAEEHKPAIEEEMHKIPKLTPEDVQTTARCMMNPKKSCPTDCAVCEIPDVYGLRLANETYQKPTMDICVPKTLWTAKRENQEETFCSLANNPPKGAKNLLTGELQTDIVARFNNKIRGVQSTTQSSIRAGRSAVTPLKNNLLHTRSESTTNTIHANVKSSSSNVAVKSIIGAIFSLSVFNARFS